MSASWIVAQIGAREHYAVPRALHRRGALQRLYTDFWSPPPPATLPASSRALRALLSRRHPDLPRERVTSFNPTAVLDALQYPLLRRLGMAPDQQDTFIQIGRRFAESVRRDLQRRGRLPENTAYFGFNTGCLETLSLLNEHGLPSVVDQIDPGVTEVELVIEESRQWPGWAETPPAVHAAYYERLKAEWDAATRVLVNSDWSREALIDQGVSADKIIVVPLAYEPPAGLPETSVRPSTGPLHVLWLGQVVLRKGIQYLIEAARSLPEKDFTFTIAGPIGISPDALRRAPANLKFLGTITRDRVSEVYREADVFVLPTVSDGFALTQLEAMAHGLPVIATRNCGRVVTDGEDGWLIEARSTRSLTDALGRCLDERDRLQEMGRRARQKLSAYTLEAYADRLDQAYHAMITERSLL